MDRPALSLWTSEDVSGKYFPKLEDDNSHYSRRKDGKVERVEFSPEGSRGTIVEDERGRLQQSRDRETDRHAKK